VNIKNTTQRGYGLPLRKGPDGKPFGGPAIVIAPGATLEVPPWYFAELAKEKGFRALFERGDLVDANAPRRAQADDRAETLERRVRELERENRETETLREELRRSKAEYAKLDKASIEVLEDVAKLRAELDQRTARVDYLERELAAKRAQTPVDAKADTKPADEKTTPRDRRGGS
jgi:septal ring factor EnvC (AmiA/AmiB activator)